jgi:hypothetical protein
MGTVHGPGESLGPSQLEFEEDRPLPLSDTMQEKDHRVKLASGVVNWDVYLISIADATQGDLPV